MKKFLVLVFFYLCGLAHGDIKVLVKDSEGVPVEGAEVKVLPDGKYYTTNMAGYAIIPNVPPPGDGIIRAVPPAKRRHELRGGNTKTIVFEPNGEIQFQLPKRGRRRVYEKVVRFVPLPSSSPD